MVFKIYILRPSYTVCRGQRSSGVTCHKVSLSSNQEDTRNYTRDLGHEDTFPRVLSQAQVFWLPVTSVVSFLPSPTDQAV